MNKLAGACLPGGQLVGEGTGAGNNADLTGGVNVTGHDADLCTLVSVSVVSRATSQAEAGASMRTLQALGLMIPGQLGPIRRVPGLRPRCFLTRTMSCWGIPSVITTTCNVNTISVANTTYERDIGVDSLNDGIGSERRGHEDDGSVGAGLLAGLFHASKDGKTQMSGASCGDKQKTHAWRVSQLNYVPFLGETPPTILVPYSMACWLWKVPCLPVKPWQMTLVFSSMKTLAVEEKDFFTVEGENPLQKVRRAKEVLLENITNLRLSAELFAQVHRTVECLYSLLPTHPLWRLR